MTFSCRYFANGSQYGQKDFAKFMLDAFDDGYVTGVGNELKCSCDGSDMRVQVATGRGYINGYSFDVTDNPEYVTLPTADPTYDRIDRIVARLSPDVNQNITLSYVQGTPASTPTAPALTRTDQKWEISLAQVKVPHGSSFIPSGNVTDEREDFSLCGRANGMPGEHITHGTVPYKRLPPATSSTVGAVKPGYGLRVDPDGTMVAVASGLSGYFAESIPGNRPGIELAQGFSFPTSGTDATSRNYDDITFAYNNLVYSKDGRYVPSIETSQITATIEIGGYLEKQKTAAGGETYITECSSATINLLHDGVVVQTKTFTNFKTETITINTTVAQLVSGVWSLTGTGTINSTAKYGIVHSGIYIAPKTPVIKYFVIE